MTKRPLGEELTIATNVKKNKIEQSEKLENEDKLEFAEILARNDSSTNKRMFLLYKKSHGIF